LIDRIRSIDRSNQIGEKMERVRAAVRAAQAEMVRKAQEEAAELRERIAAAEAELAAERAAARERDEGRVFALAAADDRARAALGLVRTTTADIARERAARAARLDSLLLAKRAHIASLRRQASSAVARLQQQ
jgi:hypothetical protein